MNAKTYQQYSVSRNAGRPLYCSCFRLATTLCATQSGLVDNAEKPFYLLLMIQKWLVLLLGLMIAALAVLVVSIIVALRRHVSVGFFP
jgi:hypothetical protein